MVGEFCVRYGYQLDHPNMSFAEIDPPTLVRLREQTISTLSELVVDLPHDTLVSPPLVRLLVDGWRTSEAVEAALAFTMADTTDAWSYTLLGFALRADRQTLAAERAFEAAFARLAAEEREELADVRPLLAGEEQPTYDELVGSGREAYRAALWRAADPLYLTPGNEVRTEHLWTCPGSVDG
jgi:hypothetical protein